MHEATEWEWGREWSSVCGWDGDGKKYIGDGAGMGLIFTTVSLFSA